MFKCNQELSKETTMRVLGFSLVKFHVTFRISRCCERFVAMYAFKWFLTSMRLHVHCWLCGCCKRLFTTNAFVGFLSDKKSQVNIQMIWTSKWFRTVTTLERVLAGVNFFVTLQTTWLSAHYVAILTQTVFRQCKFSYKLLKCRGGQIILRNKCIWMMFLGYA